MTESIQENNRQMEASLKKTANAVKDNLQPEVQIDVRCFDQHEDDYNVPVTYY